MTLPPRQTLERHHQLARRASVLRTALVLAGFALLAWLPDQPLVAPLLTPTHATSRHTRELPALSVFAIGALSALGWWRVVGLKRSERPRDLGFFLLPLLPVLLNLAVGLNVPNLLRFTELLAVAFLIGFAEEAIFRGLMLNALKARGLWQAAIITALLFGLSHSLNLLSGKSVSDI